MFKIAEYRPDREGNLLSIWAGNLSFAGKSSGMSVHVLTGTCARFQQLLTGNAGRGPDPSQHGPAAPAAHAVASQPGKQERVLPFKGKESQRQGHLGCTRVAPSVPVGDGTWDCAQQALPAPAFTRVRAGVWLPQGRQNSYKKKRLKAHGREYCLGLLLKTSCDVYNFTSVYGHRWTALNKTDTCLRTKGKHRLLKVKAIPLKCTLHLVSYNWVALKYQNRPLSKHMAVEGGSADSYVHHQSLPTIKKV